MAGLPIIEHQCILFSLHFDAFIHILITKGYLVTLVHIYYRAALSSVFHLCIIKGFKPFFAIELCEIKFGKGQHIMLEMLHYVKLIEWAGQLQKTQLKTK